MLTGAIEGEADINMTEHGQCGDNVYWELEDGMLTITGVGDMWNWNWSFNNYDMPWKNSLSSITKVLISSGVTSIGNYAFVHCRNLKSVRLSSNITYIGSSAFFGCYYLSKIDNIPDSWVDARNDLDICCSTCGAKTSISPGPGPSWDGRNILYGKIRDVRLESHELGRMAYHTSCGFDKPEIGKIFQFRVGYPFYCKMGGCFSVMINENEFATARLIKYWRDNEAFGEDCAFVWAEVILTGDVLSFVRPVSEDDFIELEKSREYKMNNKISAPCYHLEKINDNLFQLLNYDQECGTNYTIYTDKDGVDHLVRSFTYSWHDYEDFLGDEVLGLHRFFSYYFHYEEYEEEYEEMEEEEYDFNTSVHRMPPWMVDRKKR